MPCVSPEGKPTQTGLATLQSVKDGASTPGEIGKTTGHPMFRVRSGLRELVNAEFLELIDGNYSLTSEGKNVL